MMTLVDTEVIVLSYKHVGSKLRSWQIKEAIAEDKKSMEKRHISHANFRYGGVLG